MEERCLSTQGELESEPKATVYCSIRQQLILTRYDSDFINHYEFQHKIHCSQDIWGEEKMADNWKRLRFDPWAKVHSTGRQ